MATIYRADGTTAEVAPASGASFSLEELQGIVGGFIELVYLDQSEAMLVIDEEGKCKGKPINRAATRLCDADRPGWSRFDFIAGDALHCALSEVE